MNNCGERFCGCGPEIVAVNLRAERKDVFVKTTRGISNEKVYTIGISLNKNLAPAIFFWLPIYMDFRNFWYGEGIGPDGLLSDPEQVSLLFPREEEAQAYLDQHWVEWGKTRELIKLALVAGGQEVPDPKDYPILR